MTRYRYCSPGERVVALVAVMFLAAMSSSLFAITLLRGPYVQNLKPTSVIIVWVTDLPSDSEVQYGLSTPYTNTVHDGGLAIQHAVTLTGLSMGSIYHYKVRSDGSDLTGDLTFHSGKDATYNSFTFVAMGDHRSNPIAHADVAHRVEIIDPELNVDSGDLTSDGDSLLTWDLEFFLPEKDVMARSCLFPSIGNHDGTAANYMDYFYLPTESSGTERYYSFDYANAHFVIIDNYSSFSAGSAQYNWLVSDLAANQSKRWMFAVFHKPPYSSSSHGSDLTVRNTLCPLFELYGVDIVFNGHDHDYERSYVNGVYYIVTGGGGAPLYANAYSSWTQFSASAYHCCKITINGNSLNFEAIKPDGTVLDSFFLNTTVQYWTLY
jgi:hypothetical protein